MINKLLIFGHLNRPQNKKLSYGTWHLHYLHACINYDPNVVQNHT